MIDTLTTPTMGRYASINPEIKDFEENAAREAGIGENNPDGNRMRVHMRKSLKFFLSFFFIFFIMFMTAFAFISTSAV